MGLNGFLMKNKAISKVIRDIIVRVIRVKTVYYKIWTRNERTRELFQNMFANLFLFSNKNRTGTKNISNTEKKCVFPDFNYYIWSCGIPWLLRLYAYYGRK